MSTALTVYYSSAASSTLSTANQLYSTSGTPGVTQTGTQIGNNVTGWGEITSQGTTGVWAASGAIGNPTGKGFLWDVTTLEGQMLIAGNWTPTIRLNSYQGTVNVAAGTLIGDIVIRAFRRSSSGVYTPIMSSTLATQTISGFTTYTLSVTAGIDMAFGVGDKLYIDAWFNCTTNANGVSNEGIEINRLSTDTTTKTGQVGTAQVASPGYATNNLMSSTDNLSISDSFSAQDGASFTDANTASESFQAEQTGSFTESLTISDALSAQDTASFTESNTISDNLTAQDGYSTTEALSALDAFLAQSGANWVEVLPITESMSVSGVFIPSESLSALDSLLSTDAFSAIEANSISDSLLGQGVYIPVDSLTIADLQSALQSWGVDALVISDSFSTVGTFTPVESLNATDTLLATDSVSFLETLTISDSFVGIGIQPTPIPTIALIAIGRDGKSSAMGRDGKSSAKGRG